MATFYSGNSGNSTGEHLDFRVWSHETGGYVDPSSFRSYVTSNGKGLDQFPVTSPHGMREHPIHGGQRMHHGIDYGAAAGTPFEVQGGKYLTTWDDKSGGGITSQYEITHTDGKKYDILLMHGNADNKILSQSAVTDGISLADGPSPTTTPVPPGDAPTSVGPDDNADTNSNRGEAAERAKAYKSMSKSELDREYDRLRTEDPGKAADEGMKMHRAFFNK